MAYKAFRIPGRDEVYGVGGFYKDELVTSMKGPYKKKKHAESIAEKLNFGRV